MAYLVFISSVDDKEYQDYLFSLKKISFFEKLRNKTPELKSYHSFHTASFLSVAKQHSNDFNNSLKELLFEGTIVDNYFWHPLSPPKYHSSSEVRKLYTDIKEIHNLLLKIPDKKDYDEYFEFEINKILTGLQYSVDNNYGLIVMYDKPLDFARANRTKYINLVKADKTFTQ